ncbi:MULTISPECIES: WxL domain-containing protein [unclassified Lactobacillus]|uniref:WxL domain-containing protein n=1 Tax=unclassified Lactobacillus TaxID=2620435 RepID=UPI000EFA466E|nr:MULTISPECIES: WxL domain-containing protein [unclassified Lactobacillus]RMC25706.1 cell surface protein [Lactobacillus sp. ESL0247]RMC29518.1 cell surface protein [Lactobacillus sp. ESL0246]RMC33507.1 cell surface protein [Lactobacillus sp. ESL0245]
MKLTKIASLVMTSATVLSTVAAATPAIIQAKTQEGNKTMNGGKALPDTNHSTVGIGFSQDQDAKPDPNKHHDDDGVGYLRLQYVPAVLDFGSHTKFNPAAPIFTAAGKNLNNSGNDSATSKGYAGADNQTPKLTTTNPNLSGVNGKTWVTVVDKQDSRTDTDDKNNKITGDWQLSVKADGPLTTGKDADAKTIAGATLAFSNTAAAAAGYVFGLTGSVADKGYEPAYAPLSPTATKKLTVNLAADSTAVQVGTAPIGSSNGGAFVFAWDPSDIQLALPTDANIVKGTYTTSLTWTLSTGIK